MKTLRLLALLALLVPTTATHTQENAVRPEAYPFIRLEANRLHYDSTSLAMARLAARWQQVTASGQGSINIVHIGSSHVQAGTLTNTVRCDLLAAYPMLVGDRGMIFPYSAAAACNNPADYRIHCPQKMALTRNVYKEHPVELGLCGIAVTTTDTLTEMQVALNEPRFDYATTRIVVVGHSESGIVPLLDVDGRTVHPSYVDLPTGRFIYNLTHPTDSFTVVIRCPAGQQFTLNGLLLGNRKPGISYHSIGVNGAAVNDYLRCPHFVRDLRLLHPDLVVFGIGINDAASPNFDTAEFRRSYLRLVDSVRAVNPDCAFLFITNNDSYLKQGRKKYVDNPRGALARDVFYRLAEATGGAVWDQYEVMGGAGSMERWRKAGLAQADRVHFTSAGYQLIGHLLSDALLRSLAANNTNPQHNTGERYRYISY